MTTHSKSYIFLSTSLFFGALLIGLQVRQDIHILTGKESKGDPTTDVGASMVKSQHPLGQPHPIFLMGKNSRASTQETKKPSKPATETRLNYTLKGVFVSQDITLSGAVIDLSNKQPAFHLTGSEIEPKVTLYRVLSNSVIIDRNGKKESLSFKNFGKITPQPLAPYSSTNPTTLRKNSNGEHMQAKPPHSNRDFSRITTPPRQSVTERLEKLRNLKKI